VKSFEFEKVFSAEQIGTGLGEGFCKNDGGQPPVEAFQRKLDHIDAKSNFARTSQTQLALTHGGKQSSVKILIILLIWQLLISIVTNGNAPIDFNIFGHFD